MPSTKVTGQDLQIYPGGGDLMYTEYSNVTQVSVRTLRRLRDSTNTFGTEEVQNLAAARHGIASLLSSVFRYIYALAKCAPVFDGAGECVRKRQK